MKQKTKCRFRRFLYDDQALIKYDATPGQQRKPSRHTRYISNSNATSKQRTTPTTTLSFSPPPQKMQRHTPVSPPIHHPVPQRPVQVPVMQSPPPPPPHSSDPYDNPYGSGAQQYPQQGNAYPQFGGFGGAAGPGFFTDPMTAQMGFNVARAAMSGGTDLAEKNVCDPRDGTEMGFGGGEC